MKADIIGCVRRVDNREVRMPIHLRPMTIDTDFPRIAEIINTFSPEPTSARQLIEEEERAPKHRTIHRTAAANDIGLILGYNTLHNDPQLHTGQFWTSVTVDVDYRKTGIGSLLFEDGLQFARAHNGTKLVTSARDDDDDSLRFVELRGLHVDRHIFDSVLVVTTFEEE